MKKVKTTFNFIELMSLEDNLKGETEQNMGKNTFGFGYISDITETPNENGGITVTLGNAFASDKVDWENIDNVKLAASKAMNMADGFYNLICSNFNLEDPVFSNENTEIYIALGAFACELFLKSIIYFENRHDGKEVRSHNLHQLICKLSAETKNELYSRNPEFEEKIVALGEAFTEMRYMFEYNTFNKDYLLIFNLLAALKSISENYERTEMHAFRFSGGKIVIE